MNLQTVAQIVESFLHAFDQLPVNGECAIDIEHEMFNPHFAAAETRTSVPAVPGVAPVYPVSRTLPRFNDPWAANRFTSACSPIVYRDTLYGPASLVCTFAIVRTSEATPLIRPPSARLVPQCRHR